MSETNPDTSSLADILEKIKQLGESQILRTYLLDAIAQYEKHQLMLANRDRLLDKLRNASSCDASRLILEKLLFRGYLHYGPRELVPSEGDSLEKAGLLTCEYGVGDPQGLRSRTLRLTTAGVEFTESLRS